MRRRLGAPALALLSTLAGAAPALAQSAADKATAREVATEGIQLFQSQKYQEALDRLRRAQELFNAPPHLLYIARSQEKLGQLVEAAENYQLLVRYPLPEGAPESWVAGVEDGKKELAVLEPRLPRLRVLTEPKDLDESSLQIDGVAVSAAVIGIARPVNPGRHRVTLAARGRKPASADIDVAEGQSTDVRLALAVDTSAKAAAKTPEPPKKDEKPGLIGFMAGLRFGGAVPTGRLLKNNNATDYLQGGGGLELHAGVRIARYFTPVLFLEGETLSRGDGANPGGGKEAPTASSFGLGVLIGTAPGQTGGFGELDLVLAHSVTADAPGDAQDCDLTFKGGGFRIGGGGVFPLFSWLHLTPVVTATLARATSIDTSATCRLPNGQLAKGDIASGNQETHGLLFLGVGGDVVFGSDTDRK